MTIRRPNAIGVALALALFVLMACLTAAPARTSAGSSALEERSGKKSKTIRKAKRMIKNGHYEGVAANEVRIDWLFCANGAYRLSGLATGSGKNWEVVDARRKEGGLTAFVKVFKGRSSPNVVLAKRGRQWEAGLSFDGKAGDLDPVDRSNGRAACRAL